MKSKKKKKKITIKDIIRLIVLLVAFSVLLYPTFSSYLNEKNGSKVVSYYDEESVKLSKAEKEQMLEEARAYNKEMLGNIDLIDPFSQEDVEIDARYEGLLNVDGSGMMGYIRIPKINIELPIYHGTSEAVLQTGVGHFWGTSLPVGGESTHTVLTGHRGLPTKTLFTNMDKLEVGDIFYIKVLDETLAYQIDQEKGMGSYHAEIDEEALEFLADIAGGDARNALNAIELGILTTERSADGKIHITLDVASECIQKRVVRYDKTGDNHYDTISAFIKSMRGSDPDAAVYYLAKMLYAGEDVKFIARRIMICASEDVGNADPMALQVAVAAAQAVERIGMPESQIILSQAVTYVATAPKSNAAVKAISAAMENVRNYKTTVPAHLQDAHYKGSQKLGHGVGYKYAHDYPNHYVEQQYMPSEIQKAKFYEPSDNGHEKEIKEWMEFLKKNS